MNLKALKTGSSLGCLLLVLFFTPPAGAQLFENLKALGNRLKVTGLHPEVMPGGPKGISTADFDGDSRPDLATCNVDGSVTVYFGEGEGRFSREETLITKAQTLRDIVAADLTADGKPDIAVTDPPGARLVILANQGGRSFSPPLRLDTWQFARNLEAGDFNGDGITDLVVAGNGLGMREYHGTPGGGLRPFADLPDLYFPPSSMRPVYSLEAFRPHGSTRDDLVATHALLAGLLVFTESPPESLRAQANISGVEAVHYTRVGKLARPEGDAGPPDLVTVHKALDKIQLRLGTAAPARFQDAVHQEIHIPLEPRAVEILDLDGDGWNDIVVAVRKLDRVLTFHNDHGRLVAAHEMPVGSSPRELASADFNGDGVPDVAVINRWSSDISILPAYPNTPGFSALDQVYLVDGDVAVLEVEDLNADRRDDVIQLHQASGDVSIRLAEAEGRLGQPRFYPMGTRPDSMALIDMDKDGDVDLVTASINRLKPSVSFRLGDGPGTFGSLTVLELSSQYPGGYLIGILAADFDGDGDADLALGIYDCSGSHIVFLENAGGSFRETNRFGLRYVQDMGTADFDRDGDLDFAAVSGAGELAVLESPGNLLAAPDFRRTIYDEMKQHGVRGTGMTVKDLNADGDPDLLVTGSSGFIVYRGAAGMTFVPEPNFTGNVTSPISDSASADFDADGDIDIAVACKIASCISILTQGENMQYSLALSVDVPAARHLATGDVDGDGFADLVGSGNALWTALSSRRGKPAPPPVLDDRRERIPGVVINEVLAINQDLPLVTDGGKKPDWVEVFNGGSGPVSLSAWRLTLEVADQPASTFTFPPAATLESGAHRLVIFSPSLRSEYHTGFRLPGEGGKLTLWNGGAEAVDKVAYSYQFEDVSYARYRDGIAAFTFNPKPSPGTPNEYTGSMPPQFDFLHLNPAAPAAGEPVQFLGRGRDDIGIADVTLVYRTAGGAGAPAGRLDLLDISFGPEAESGERTFLGRLEKGLPAGVVKFYFEVTDRSGNQTTVPEGGSAMDGEDEGEGPFRIAVGVARESLPKLEVSEVVARNEHGLSDERGGHPDWVEIRNCSSGSISLNGFFLAKNFPGSDGDDWYAFPGTALGPGGHFLVLCDGNPDEGPGHAPFSLDSEGDRVFLVWRSHGGVDVAVDEVGFGTMDADVALARAGCGGSWVLASPTPGSDGFPRQIARGDVNASGGLDIADPIAILGHLFLGTQAACPRASDVNGDSLGDITDSIYLLLHLFQGGDGPEGEPVPAEKCLEAD